VPIDALCEAESGYLAPRQVLVGPRTSHSSGQALRSWGVGPGPVLVIADRVVSEAGLLDQAVAGLTDTGFAPHVFAEVAGEPDDTVTSRASELARSLAVVAVIGVGGGSAMDVAKVVALLRTNDGQVADWLGVVMPSAPVAPLLLIPTTTGTGSEATRISMITVAGSKRVISCSQFVPLIAILDDDLVASLPTAVVASTGMDAVAHAVESILSTNRSSFSLAAAGRALALLRDELEPAVGGDPRAKARVLYAAHLSGLALNAGVVVGHSLAYVIARHAPMPHGASCALALPYCLAYNRAIDDGLADYVAVAVTGEPRATMKAAAEHLEALTGRLGLPQTLASVGITGSELGHMAAETVADYPRPNNPVPLENQGLTTLLQHMHRGDLAAAW
jgi:alcohol dehydrogenase class IV